MNQFLTGRSFYVFTYGCQMNEHDSERIVGMLEACGAHRTDVFEDSEIVIFMTCCVREAADVRLRGQVNSIKNVPLPRTSELKKRVVCIGGCIGQRDGQQLIDDMHHVDVVFGTQNIERLPYLINGVLSRGGHIAEVQEESDTFSTDLPSKREHDWAAWLPITVGCNNFCTYCIVPYVRGRERSRAIESVVADAQALVAEGVQEITLLGQNVNSYGRDLYGEPRFADVLKGVAATGVPRLRFATSHPKDLTDEVIEAFGTLGNLMPALHLPVQSGSDAILKRMHRSYTVEHYLGLIDKLRAACPDISLSTDIIVGFPGETEEDFQATYDLVEKVGYSQVFTFIYSPREGTPAAKMKDDTPRSVIQERFERLVQMVQDKAYEQNQRFADRTLDVLVEGVSQRNDSIIAGRSPHNAMVHAPIPEGKTIEQLKGTIIPVHVDEAKTWYLSGTVVE
ncbi:tRNA (N6-isopentenyl adenosine(37)-C2)-methylthiotransferase MiaB [Slackia heliotrinireducens]|uniref:tRNA-2-methylthio-N(6)-dimethylallyladenosine synthase n=1 Tax=Slackia heliotrinireducens (strain ATCC 29202 / DSM 20476 / NCTC 11029 / RHS 1) TaxID=471855 RepID=C7N5C7_SLAHD|nr:tRNA-N(6)-(isopentenyl)adenosine-37 thiotransferase enzyme MiaB [Slackia heliotrinireducens DSM 20476]VEH00126.1 (Dimethylallyl)adenosine tRNA methylthiotransferase MiaB [Slackia heliotrinireducens]